MTTNSEQESKKPDAVIRMEAIMEKLAPTIETVTKSQVDPDRLTRLIISAAVKQPRLFECTATSIALGVMAATMLKLEPNSALGHCYLVPFKNWKKSEVATQRNGYNTSVYEAQFIMGYKGLIYLGHRNRVITSGSPKLVFNGDEWDIEAGTPFDQVKHKPSPESNRSEANFGANVVVAYVVLHLPNGPAVVEWMFRDQIEEIRQMDRRRDGGIWADHWGQMARKTVLKRAFNYIPCGDDLASAMALDGRMQSEEIDLIAGDFGLLGTLPDDQEAEVVHLPENTPEDGKKSDLLRQMIGESREAASDSIDAMKLKAEMGDKK